MMNPARRDAALQSVRLESSGRACAGRDAPTGRHPWLRRIAPAVPAAALALLTGLLSTLAMAQAAEQAAAQVPGPLDVVAPPDESSAIGEEPRSGTRSSSNPASSEAPGRSAARIADQVADRDRRAAIPAPADRLQLDTTVVTGNRELPKVLYIVPWKKAGLGEPPGQPFNTLLDEVLAPVDRDVFRREVTYYGVVSGSADSAARREAAATR